MPASPPSPALLWARLPIDKRQQLRDLLGGLLARLHEARHFEEADRE